MSRDLFFLVNSLQKVRFVKSILYSVFKINDIQSGQALLVGQLLMRTLNVMPLTDINKSYTIFFGSWHYP